VVDEEPLFDLSAGVDVDTGQRVSDLGDDPRPQRRAEPVELMRQAVAHDRGQPRKAKDDLVDAFRRWVVGESGADVPVESGADLRQSRGKGACDLSRRSRLRTGRIACVLFLARRRRRRKRRRAAGTAFIGAVEASVRNDLQVKGRRRHQFPVALYRY
jgi:hypothetical protein